MLRSLPRWWYVLFLCLLLAANIDIYKTVFAPRVLEVEVLPIGKGDAILARAPSGTTLLIDTGADASILRALGAALPEWQRHIDAVVLTSENAVSSGALPEVMQRYRIGTLLRSGTRGERLALGSGAFADILWPPATPGAMSAADSIRVLRLSYGATAFLIQENLSPRAAAWLATLDADLPVSNVVISSTTPASVFSSNGEAITKTR